MPDMMAVTIETFGEEHPAVNPELLVEHARVALNRYHTPPAVFAFCKGSDERPVSVHFSCPDPRSEYTLEREDFVEKGAIVMAGVAIRSLEGKQITRVLKRGARVDYFVGEAPGDFRWILEVGGTDAESFEGLRNRKRKQLAASPYRQPPHSKDGFVSVTRFAPPAATASDSVPSA